MSAPTLLQQALDLLRDAGIARGSVRAEGPEGEVLVLAIPTDEEHLVFGGAGKDLTHRLRALGYRYVALDLAEGEPSR